MQQTKTGIMSFNVNSPEHQGVCRYWIFEEAGEEPVFVVSSLPESVGIINFWTGTIATELWRHAGQPPTFRYIEIRHDQRLPPMMVRIERRGNECVDAEGRECVELEHLLGCSVHTYGIGEAVILVRPPSDLVDYFHPQIAYTGTVQGIGALAQVFVEFDQPLVQQDPAYGNALYVEPSSIALATPVM